VHARLSFSIEPRFSFCHAISLILSPYLSPLVSFSLQLVIPCSSVFISLSSLLALILLMHQTRLALHIRAVAYARTCFTLYLSPVPGMQHRSSSSVCAQSCLIVSASSSSTFAFRFRSSLLLLELENRILPHHSPATRITFHFLLSVVLTVGYGI
jgi:hypothetical protein